MCILYNLILKFNTTLKLFLLVSICFILLVFSTVLIYLNSFNNNTIYGQIQTEETANVAKSDDVKDLISKGNSLYDLGNYAGALQYYDKALAVNPNDLDALYSKGIILHQLGK